MSKIFEALQKAQEEHKELAESPLITHQVESPADIQMEIELRMENEMLMLYQSIDSLLPGLARKTVQFIAAREGEGTSTIVREFANTSALKLGKSVLVVDADHGSVNRGASYGIAHGQPDEDALVLAGSLELGVHKTINRNVFVSPVSRNYGTFLQKLESSDNEDFFGQMKLKYDLVLIDSPAVSRNSLGLAFCRRVDGVVIVLEAEKTRLPVVESAKSRIIGCGGNILGVVLNKRRFNIPESVYSRL